MVPTELVNEGLLVDAFHTPWYITPPTNADIWFCTLPKACNIESVADIVPPPVKFNPLKTLPVTAVVDNVTLDAPGPLAVASPVKDVI